MTNPVADHEAASLFVRSLGDEPGFETVEMPAGGLAVWYAGRRMAQVTLLPARARGHATVFRRTSDDRERLEDRLDRPVVREPSGVLSVPLHEPEDWRALAEVLCDTAARLRGGPA